MDPNKHPCRPPRVVETALPPPFLPTLNQAFLWSFATSSVTKGMSNKVTSKLFCLWRRHAQVHEMRRDAADGADMRRQPNDELPQNSVENFD